MTGRTVQRQAAICGGNAVGEAAEAALALDLCATTAVVVDDHNEVAAVPNDPDPDAGRAGVLQCVLHSLVDHEPRGRLDLGRQPTLQVISKDEWDRGSS
ncbi:MAG TPA: hypothetical protein VF462_05805 [Micromonosporaceae bacterium]